ncbi:MAG: Gfo/Idh/MocA family oxidoreductase [Oligosphaeraceae bacterium]|nr:Gfo/Idh/MocA family oxidoreductase [Oligosphaeraceae bacterium]
MKKLKVIQIGVSHEHASGKIQSLKMLPELFEIVGVVNDLKLCDSPRFITCIPPQFDGLPFLSLEEALNLSGVDAAIVEVPNLELIRYAEMCVKKGLPVHLDKTAGQNLSLYRDLLELCKAKHVPLQMGYMYRGNPALEFVKKLIVDNILGTVFDAHLDMNHGYGGDAYQEYLGNFRGGIMFNLGCHLIDFVIAAMGAPDKVTPFLKSTPDVGRMICNNALAVLEYPCCCVQISACSRAPEYGVQLRRWRFTGTNGMLEVAPPERFDGKPVKVNLILKEAAGGYPAGKAVFEFAPQADRYVGQLKEFAAIVRGEMENPYTYQHDYLVHKTTLAAAGHIPYKKESIF